MALFRFFHRPQPDSKLANTALAAIVGEVTSQTGVDRFILKEGTAIFSGNEETHNMTMELYQLRSKGKSSLTATLYILDGQDVVDESTWHQRDFENFEDFALSIADYISLLINRTVKFTTEWKRQESMTFTVSVLNVASGQYEVISSDKVDTPWITWWLKNDKVKESVCVFSI